MANNDYFSQYLEDETNKQRFDDLLENSTFLDLIEQKREDVGSKAEQKKAEFINQTINLEEGFDADTLYNIGRLASQPGYTFDAYETAKYDPITKALLPYLGKDAPTDDGKRSKKWNLHRIALGKKYGIPFEMVTQQMLNDEAVIQAEAFKALLYKGQDPDSPTVSVDIRQDGEGYFGRPLITVRNPVTGEIINEVMNTPETNAMFYSSYNRRAYEDGVQELHALTTSRNRGIGQGFWDSLGKGLSGGVDNLQATGYGFAALIADASGSAQLGDWFLKQYLRNIDEAYANGAQLPGIEDIDWFGNPTQVLSKLGALIGEAFPSIALMIGTGGIGGLIAKQVVKGGVRKLVGQGLSTEARALITRAQMIGRGTGAYGSAAYMEIGSIYGDVAEAGKRDLKSRWGALAGGTVAGALEAFYPVRLMNKFGLTRAANRAAKKSFLSRGLGANLKNFAKELLAGGLTEGTTEGLQFITEEVTQDLIKEGHLPDYKSEEFFWGLMNSIVAGLVPGATFSGTASTVREINNRIGGDARATDIESSIVHGEAQEAADAIIPEGDKRSADILDETVNTIENIADELDITLDETYKGQNTLNKAVQLIDALTRIENKKKGDTNPEVIKAKESLSTALENFQSGDINLQTSKDAALLLKESERTIEDIKAEVKRRINEKTKTGKDKTKGAKATIRKWGRKQIATEKAALQRRLKPVRVVQSKGTRAATKVIREEIQGAVKKLNRITRKLRDPNLSKKQRKRLERERNAQGRHIENLKGTVELSSTLNKQIENALKGDWFIYKKSNIGYDKVLIDEIAKNESIKNNEVIVKDILENPKATVKERVDAFRAFINDYKAIQNAVSKIKVAIGESNNKIELKSLEKTLKILEKKLDSATDTYKKVLAVKFEKPATQASDKDVLYSMLPIDEKSLKKLNDLREQLSPEEETLLDAHIALAKAEKILEAREKGLSKTLTRVRDDILLGDEEFKGFLYYLNRVQKGNLEGVIDDVIYFINSLQGKLTAFNKAKEIIAKEDINKVWIDKTTKEIIRTKPLTKDGKEDLDNYWWVTPSSEKLINYIKAEVLFGKAVLKIIKLNTELAPGRTQEIEQDEALREGIDLLDEEIKKTKETETDLDEIVIEEEEVVTPEEDADKEYITVYDPNGIEHRVEVVARGQDGGLKIISPQTGKEVIISETGGGIYSTDNPLNQNYIIQSVNEGIEGKKKLQIFELPNEELDEFIKKYTRLVKENEALREQGQLGLWNQVRDLTAAKAEKVRREGKPEVKPEVKPEEKPSKDSKVTHFLNKFKDSFLKLYRTKLKGSKIFKIAQLKRESFYSRNKEPSLVNEDGTSRIPKMLKDLLGKDFKDEKFIGFLDKYFLEFKNSFEKHNRKVNVTKSGDPEAFHNQEFLQLLYVEINGVKTLPDEIIFAMMLSTLQWMSINNFNSEVTDEQTIGLLLYNDRQADLTREEIRAFNNMGILFRDATSEIGLDIFNNLNLKIDSKQLQGLDLNEVLQNISEFIQENGDGLLPDDIIAKQLQVALGGTALAIATDIHTSKSRGLDGLIEVVIAEYYHDTFEGEPNKDLPDSSPNKGLPTRKMKTIKFPHLQERKIPFGLEELFESIKNNKEAINTINGTDSSLSGPLSRPSKIIQKFVRNSFIQIPEKTRDVVRALQKVPWVGKKQALELWRLTDESTRKRVVGIVNLDEKHNVERPGYETSNKDKLRDIELIDEYDGKPFWFKYSVQKQNRINIDSNGINGQRSKAHRALFMPKGSDVTINTEFKRAMYQMGIVQAFGYSIDKNTLQNSLLEFDLLYERASDIVEYVKAGNIKEERFNELLNELLDKEGIDASMHVIEAIASLTNYHPTKNFKSASLGIETDGITNGYAISQLQFLGVPQKILDEGTDEEIVASLVESLARIGVMVEPGMTMERFIKEGNLDVYQSLANFVKETLEKPDALETINKGKPKWLKEITKQQISALDVIHGEIWTDSLTNEITTFGRNLAKNPLMISGYGAEIRRIIGALADDVIPAIYDKLADFQVRYDNATKTEKAKILAEFTLYAEALNNFIPRAAKRLPAQLIKGNLKRIVFSDAEIKKVHITFQTIFTPAITTALDQFTKPLQEARDAIIRSGEWQFTSFIFYYDRAIEEYKDSEEFKNSPGNTVPLAVERAISRSLALKYMPMIYGEWSDPDTPLQVIKSARIRDKQRKDVGRVVIPLPTKTIPKIIKDGAEFTIVYEKDKDGKRIPVMITREELDSHAYAREYVTPGVSTYSNTIQNIDSVLLGKLILQNPEILAIFDASMSNIEQAYDNNTTYNEGFRDTGINHSILKKALERLTDVKNAIEPSDLKAIEDIYRETSFQGEALLKRINNLTDKNPEKAALQAEYDALSFKVLEDTFNAEIKRVDQMKALLEKAYPGWLENATISQMYLPESLKSILDGTASIESIKDTTINEIVNPELTTHTGLEGTSISAETFAGYKGAKDAAIKLAKDKTQTRYVRTLAKLIIPLISDDVGISTDFTKHVRIGGEMRSHYNPTEKVVVLNPADDTTVLLHELIHAATQVILYRDAKDRTARQNNAVKQLHKIREDILKVYLEDVKKQTNDEGVIMPGPHITEAEANAIHYLLYGSAKNVETNIRLARKNMKLGNFEGLYDFEALGEFLTQVLTQPDAQSYLKRKTIAKKTLWNKLVTSVRNLLNLKDGEVDTLLDQALSVTLESIEALVEETTTQEEIDAQEFLEQQLTESKRLAELEIKRIEEETKQREETEAKKRAEEAKTDFEPYDLGFKDKETGEEVRTNASQTRAIDTMKNWWANTQEKVFVLAGRGGTGKTTIVDKAIEVLVNKDGNKISPTQVRFALPTHKAKQVIEKAAKRYSSEQFSTIAALLGMKPDGYDEQGNQVFKQIPEAYEASQEALTGVKLIVIDETSMVSVSQTEMLLELAGAKGIRLLFMGDHIQLPPIHKDKTRIFLAPIFANVLGLPTELEIDIDQNTSYAKLTERMRQKNESPILGITDIIANSIEHILDNIQNYDWRGRGSGFTLPKIAPDSPLNNGTTEGVFYADGKKGTGATDATIKQFAEEYNADKENVRYIWYYRGGHEKTIALRKRMRKVLFPDEEHNDNVIERPWITGEQIVLGGQTQELKFTSGQTGVSVPELSTDLHNGDTVVVTKELGVRNFNFTVENKKYRDNVWNDIPVNVIEVETVGEGTPKTYQILVEHKDTKATIRSQMTEAQANSKKDYIMQIQLNSILSTDMSPGYLINVHKAQGSTYKTVYADYDNTVGIWGPGWFDQLSGLYVATSRPTTKLVLVGTGDLEFGDAKGELSENIEILQKLEDDKNTGEDVVQSLDNEIDTEAKKIWDTNSLATTAQNIFDKLSNTWDIYYPNAKEKQNQDTHLQRVLNEIILPTGTALDNVTLELHKSKLKAWGAVGLQSKKVKIHINKHKPKSYAEMTAQEVYLHELIHILTNSPLASNQAFRADIRRIRTAVKAELDKMDRPYEMFLHKDSNGKIITLTNQAQEIAAAKEQYDYVFGLKTPPKYVLDEFLAYALTNKHLVRQLSSMPANVVPLWNKESDAHVVEKLLDMLTELINRLTNIFNSKTHPANVQMEIFNLTKEMVTVSHEKSGTIRETIKKIKFAERYDNANDATSDFLKDAASKGLTHISDAYIKGVDKLTKDGKIDNFLANVLYDTKLVALMTSSYGKFINSNPKVQQHLDKAFQKFRGGHNIASLKADMFGGIPEDFIKLLYQSQKEVDRARYQYKEITREFLLNEFKDLDSLTKNEKDAITRVLFKADFSVLEDTGAYDMETALTLLTNNKLLKDEITKYARKLGIIDKKGTVINKHYFIQADQLAEFMMGGQVYNSNNFKNAHLIHQKNSKKSKSKTAIADLDVYITLLALQKAETHSKKEVANVVKREFKLDNKNNGITNIIHHHIAFKENSRKDLFDDNPILMTKGYIAKITDPTIQIEFAPADEETQAKMKKNGYDFISSFELITGLGDSNYGIYVINNLPDSMRAKGIASVTSKHHAGTSFKEILARNPAAVDQIGALFTKWSKTQASKQNTLDKNHTMMPIVNEKGEITDYSIHMNHVLMERLLKQELAFDEVLPTMFSHSQDKVASEKINKEAIDLLYTHSRLNYEKSPGKYVNILEGEYKEEYFDVLPRETRNYIEETAQRNTKRKKVFYVERKLLDTVFGYKMPSIADSILFKSRLTGEAYNFTAQRRVKVIEKVIFELVALAKVNIVIKIPMVFMFNVMSNFITSVVYGVPLPYVVKKWKEGFKELERYQKDAKKLKLLELKQIGNPALRNDPKIKLQRKALITEMNHNKVSKLIDMGLFNSITEDINRNDFTYRHKSLNTLRKTKIGQKFDNMFKGNVVKLANQAYMGEETATFKTMMHLTQASDFVARYAMYSHAIEVKGMDEAKAYKQMVETFVNYDQPLNKYLQYGNDIGLLFFVKYWLRIQRATFNLAKEKPLNVGMLFVANSMLGLDFESIFESSVLTGNFFPTEGGPIKVLGEVLIFPGLEILAGEGLSIG